MVCASTFSDGMLCSLIFCLEYASFVVVVVVVVAIIVCLSLFLSWRRFLSGSFGGVKTKVLLL